MGTQQTEQFNILAAQPADRERLIKLSYEAQAAINLKIVPDYFRAWPPSVFSNGWDTTFANPDTQRAKVAWRGDTPVGFYRVGEFDPDYLPFLKEHPIPPNTGELHQIYLLPESQGMGLGKRFYEMAKQDLRELGYSQFMICAFYENTHAKEFYRRQGAKPFAEVVFDVNYSNKDFKPRASFLIHSLG